MKKYTVYPGHYFLGDPCYCFPDEADGSSEWETLLKDTSNFSERSVHWPHLFAGPTIHGDGIYRDASDVPIFVDSGTLGLIHERYWGLSEKALSSLGHVMHITEESVFSVEDGIFYLNGEVIVDTSDSFDEEEYEEYE